MYYYEHVLSEHRERVARGARNCERLRIAAERSAEKFVGESNSDHNEELIDEDFALYDSDSSHEVSAPAC